MLSRSTPTPAPRASTSARSALAAPDDPRRGRLLLVLGRSRWLADARGEDELAAASEALLATGDREGAAEAEALLAEGYWARGQRESAAAHLERASTLIDELAPSATKASTLCMLARSASRASDYVESARISGDALALAESLELDEVRASALVSLGAAKLELGEDEGGFADLEESIELARSLGSPEAIRGEHHSRPPAPSSRALPRLPEALRGGAAAERDLRDCSAATHARRDAPADALSTWSLGRGARGR